MERQSRPYLKLANDSCLVGNIPSTLDHLHAGNTSLVSHAPLTKIEPFKKRMNGTVPWFSLYVSDFTYDFDVTDDEGEKPGLSIFLREGGDLFHTYSTNGRGVDILLGIYTTSIWLPLEGRRPGKSSLPR